MAKAQESIEIKASPDACYKVITDYETYPEFLKETVAVSVDKKSGNNFEVTFTLHIIKKFSYTLKMVGKPGKEITWTFVKGEFMKDNKGGWILEEVKKGVTKATYAVDLQLGLLVPGAVAKMLVEKSLPTMLKAFKERIENRK